MDLSDLIALGAVIVAGLSAYYTRESIKRERRDRETEIALLRQQVEGEAADRAARGRAEIVAEYAGGSGGDKTDGINFDVTNAGPAVAREPVIWATANVGMQTDVVITGRQSAGAVLRADETRRVRLNIPVEWSRAGVAELWAAWRDEHGTQEEKLLSIPRFG